MDPHPDPTGRGVRDAARLGVLVRSGARAGGVVPPRAVGLPPAGVGTPTGRGERLAPIHEAGLRHSPRIPPQRGSAVGRPAGAAPRALWCDLLPDQDTPTQSRVTPALRGRRLV